MNIKDNNNNSEEFEETGIKKNGICLKNTVKPTLILLQKIFEWSWCCKVGKVSQGAFSSFLTQEVYHV